jgi:hypothetical protein
MGPGSAVHARFQAHAQQLAGASEAFHREAVDFVMRLLQAEPARRMTAQQALRHPFLSGDCLGVAVGALPPKLKQPAFVPTTTGDRIMCFIVDKLCDEMEQEDHEDDEGVEEVFLAD